MSLEDLYNEYEDKASGTVGGGWLGFLSSKEESKRSEAKRGLSPQDTDRGDS